MAAVTLTMIARRAGVSHPVVSKVLHGGTAGIGVSAATAERVRAVATELGYRPNAAARAMCQQRFNSIGLLLGTGVHTSVLSPQLLSGALEACRQRNVHLVVDRLPDDRLTSKEVVPKLLREVMADGLLIDYTHNIPARMIELFADSHMPCVWLNSPQPADAVYPDDRHGGERLAQHLVDLGHRRILFVDFTPREHYSSDARHDGYLSAVRQAGCTPLTCREYLDEQERLATMVALLRTHQPTAVVTYGDTWHVVTAAHMLGWTIPRDLSVASFAGSPIRAFGLRMTTAVTPETEEGMAAVDLLERKIAQPNERFPPVILPYTLAIRESTAVPRAESANTPL